MSRTNWGQNLVVNPRTVEMPNGHIPLMNAVAGAHRSNRQIRAMGSTMSFSDCWAAQDVLVDTRRLNGILAFSRGRQVWGHTVPGRRASRGDESAVLVEALRDEVLASGRLFAHVEAGITLRELIDALDHPERDLGTGRERWALPTMGGASGQTLAGALSTGTHGGDFDLPPMADMVRCIHLVACDGSIHWIERPGAAALTTPAKIAALGARGHLLGLNPQNVHYDEDLFRAALVSLGRMGIVYAYVLEVRPQFGLSERVRPSLTWRQVRAGLLDGSLFTGTGAIPWLADHPRALASGAPVAPRPRGLSLFINPYRIGDDYDDRTPDRHVLLATVAEAPSGFDPPLVRPGGGVDNATLNGLVVSFEAAHHTDVLRGLVNQVIQGLRSPEGTRGYPAAHSVLDTTSGAAPPILSWELVVSTAGNRHVRFVDRLLEIFDGIIRENWRRGNRIRFAGGFNLRYTRPTAALLGMQSPTPGAGAERFCHVEVIVLKELAANPIFWDPPRVHAGHHDLESASEEWMRQFERATAEFGARMHWGQLHQLDRARVERGYPATLPAWRRALTRLVARGRSATFDSSFSTRCGLEPNTEALAGTSWGPDRYDLFAFNEAGEVQQLWYAPGWVWSNLGNGFPDGERFTGPLAATSWGHNRIDVFGVGRRGTLLQLWWQDGWHWTDLTREFPAVFRADIPLTGTLAALSPGFPRIEVFGLDARGQVWRFWFGSRGWVSRNLGNGFAGGERFVGSLSAVSDAPGAIHLFGLGTRGQVLRLRRSGGTDEDPAWTWEDLSAALPPDRMRIAGPLAASSPRAGRIDVFSRGALGGLVQLTWTGAWSAQEMPGRFPGRVRRLGMPHAFGEAAPTDHSYRYEERQCAADHFAGPLVSVCSAGSQHVFGFGESGSVLQVWRAGEGHGWGWVDLGNGWVRWADRPVKGLVVDLRTGDDGVRVNHPWGASQVYGVVKLRGRGEVSLNLSNGQEWSPGSLTTRTIDLPPGVRLGDIEAFALRFASAGPDIDADNWKLDEVAVSFRDENWSGPLLRRCGSPLWYFHKNSHQVWEVPVGAG